MNSTTRFAANNNSATNNGRRPTAGPRSNNSNTYVRNNAGPSASSTAAATTAASAASAASNSPGVEVLQSLGVSLNSTIPTLDPTSQAGLITVPILKTMDTKGRTEYLSGIVKKEVSLCCLFQKARCHAADKCHQIHVDTAFIKNVRIQNAHVISCCRQCKDTASLSSAAVTFFATHFPDTLVRISNPDGRYSTVKAVNVSITIGLTQHVEQILKQNGGSSATGAAVSAIPAKKMCRLHLRGACKYGKDCKNVHLCSKLGEAVLVPTMISSSPAAPASSSVATTRAPTPTLSVVGSSTTPVVGSAAASQQQQQRRGSAGGIMDRNTSAIPVGAEVYTTAAQQRRGSTTSTGSSASTTTATVASTSMNTADSDCSSNDAPKDYFSEKRFQTPPPMAIGALSRSGSLAPSKKDNVTEDDDCLAASSRFFSPPTTENQKPRKLSYSEVDMSNISFMENSVAINNLCFDPAMALEASTSTHPHDLHEPKQLSADWLLVEDMAMTPCGCSSTTSQKSPLPTPCKMLW